MTNSRTSRRLVAGSLAAAAVAVFTAAGPAAASYPYFDRAPAFEPAPMSQQYVAPNFALPTTPDAVAGWMSQRGTGQHSGTDTGRPSTPDSLDGFIQRRTGEHFAPETSAPEPPANWRQLMDEVP